MGKDEDHKAVDAKAAAEAKAPVDANALALSNDQRRVKVLVKQRDACDMRLQNVLADVTSWTKPQPSTLAPLPAPSLTRLKDTLEDLNDIKKLQEQFHGELYVFCHGGEFMAGNHDSIYNTTIRKIRDAKDSVNGLIVKHTPVVPNTQPSIPIITPSPAKLEPLKVPTFNGNFEEWKSFHDLFQAMIHNRANLSGAEKLTYLQAALKGQASSVISSFEPTDANYAEAWDHLKSRYEVKREIIFSYLKQFEDFKPKHTDTDCGLRTLSDALAKCVRCLKGQTVKVEEWDLIFIYMALKKLDPESKKQWALDQKNELPTVTEFVDFMETRARALTSSASSQSKGTSKPNSTVSHHVSNANTTNSCIKCKGSHRLFQCTQYMKMDVSARRSFIQMRKLCWNCLQSGHAMSNCPNQKSCYKCGSRHHTSPHIENPAVNPVSASQSSPVNASHCASHQLQPKVALLGTLIVEVKDSTGTPQQCRVFVDNGSESHFVSQHCITRLGLKPTKTRIPVNGIGNRPGPVVKGQVNLTLHSRSRPYSLDLTALVLPKFAGLIPRTHCQSEWTHLTGLKLSDPEFHSPHYTDILLGGKKVGHILLPQKVEDFGDPEAPVAWNTKFGWMVTGESPPLSNFKPEVTSVHHAIIAQTNNELDESLTRFWAQEEFLPLNRPMSSDDIECEEHFAKTHSLNEDGTYTVRLPFKSNHTPLGKSRESAVRRFLKIEERLIREPKLHEEYSKQLAQFQSYGFIEPVPTADLAKPPASTYYMPHHVVVNEASSSTPYRIVYDASAKTSTGVSLNDTLYTGTKLQVDLWPLLIRFMTHQVVMSADIWKFYPMTSIHSEDRDFQRFVWRESPKDPIMDYRMTRVTFGVSAAPFLAIRSLHELADRVKDEYPKATKVIKEDFLVDNLLTGATDFESARELQCQLLKIMHVGGMKLLKWTSNCQQLMDLIPPELRDQSVSLSIDESDFVKTIGILWNPKADIFSIQISLPESPKVTTKRTVLSAIARTFDPLGWLSPVTVRPKLLIQDLWKAKLGWDEPLPVPFRQQWHKYCEELPLLQQFQIQRNAFAPPNPKSTFVTYQLHGFSDGSDLAHAACVYVRCEDAEGRVTVNLLTAKSKVNPVAKPTTPRSELCGALLLSNLMSAVQESAHVNFSSVHCWTDSTVVLGRLSPEKKLPIFELNRIRKIISVLPAQHWKHVCGEENPADAPSRGISAPHLLDHPLWLHGPSWLKDPIDDCSVSASISTVACQPVSESIRACSDFVQMKRRVALVQRFIYNCRAKTQNRRVGNLTTVEDEAALKTIIKIVQAEGLSDALELCQRALPHKAPLKYLSPFLDEFGILRVGGRLNLASIPYSQKHQALLPKNHHFCDVVASYYHKIHLHAGPTLLLSILREQFWICRGPDLVKRVVKRCVTCHRHKTVTSNQLMGQLPSSRVTPSPAFSQAGVDYAGPFHLALRTGRKPPIVKAYVAVFVCMVTKAAHLELVSDLSTDAFIAALNRFVSRRGYPENIYSDEGTNFVGAKRELKEIQDLITSTTHQNSVQRFLSPKGIQFHTNPPAAPHHGGLWEAAVKSMKHHLRRVLGAHHVTTEEFRTLLCQVEAILNSRPLTPMSEDPNETSALTPGHFLIGRPMVALPHPDLTELPINRLSRWQLIQSYVQDLWKAWQRDYLSLLQSRPKWYQPLPDLKPGTLVLLLDSNVKLGPQSWSLGRIVNTFLGKDSKTRVCDVMVTTTEPDPRNPAKPKVKKTILRRPVVKLSPLPIY